MYKVTVVILATIILLSSCATNNEEELSLIEEKNNVIVELQMTLERINDEYEQSLETKESQIIELEKELNETSKTNKDDMIQYSSKIEELENSISELEESLYTAKERAYGKSGYNMITGYSDGRIGMGYNPEYIELYSNLMIIGYGEFDLIKHEIVDLSGGNEASMKIDISGELYNFRLGYIEWDSEYKEFTMTEVVFSMDMISNTSVLFNSVLAEGIPGEAFMWTDETGKEFSYLIGDNSLRGDTFPYIIISELLEWLNRENPS